jgi:hypothetical protein
MDDDRLRASVIVRVMDGRRGLRIQVVVLGRGQVREFRTWDEALRFVRGATSASGLR